MEHAGPDLEHLHVDALASFVAIARDGGLNAASRRTGVPKATLSRRIRQLEAAVGLPLLTRGPGRSEITEDGRSLLGRAGPLLAELGALWAETRAQSGLIRGRLRVSMPVLFGQFGMGEIAARFLKAHPGVELEVSIDDRFVDPVAEGFDVVIRANPSTQSDLVGRRLLRTRSVLAAVPEFVRPSGSAEPINAIVLSGGRNSSTWSVLGPDGEFVVTVKDVMRCSSMMLVRDTVRAGAGIALLPEWLIADDVAAGRLVVWGIVPNRDIEVWALHAPGQVTSPKIRAFVNHLVDSVQGDPTSAQR